MSYTIISVTPDTPEWLAERRKSIGASEVAAVMRMSPYATPLDVYRSKLGIDREFDELLSFVGHESETIIHKWVEQYSGLGVVLEPGFMARSVEAPFLHASFDRVSFDPFTTFQFKTSHQYAGHHWDEGIPTDVRVQVQAEMFVAGTQRAAVVVWIGGREFRLFWEHRDDTFIREQMIPQLAEFWERVQERRQPEPTTVGEIIEVYPGEPELETDLSDTALETLERITVLNSDIKAQTEERDALKVTLATYVGDATVLTHQGRKVATWKPQKGRTGFDKTAFAADHPHLLAKYTTVGAPFRVLRPVKTKEETK